MSGQGNALIAALRGASQSSAPARMGGITYFDPAANTGGASPTFRFVPSDRANQAFSPHNFADPSSNPGIDYYGGGLFGGIMPAVLSALRGAGRLNTVRPATQADIDAWNKPTPVQPVVPPKSHYPDGYFNGTYVPDGA